MMSMPTLLVWDDHRGIPPALQTGLSLDTPAWIAWLDEPTTTRFSYPVYNAAQGYYEGFMTVRKEQRARGGHYWTVYWRVNGRLRKVYLGPATAVTVARLRAIGATWLAQIPAAPPP